MCGIAGLIHADGRKSDLKDSVEAMIKAIRHRGPDELRVESVGEGVFLASARLAIIDIRGGHQPMTSPDGRWALTYNGEIFNYLELKEALASNWQFRTESDTEVLLAHLAKYGESGIQALNGQFAFCLYDRKERRALIARDRVGERPLFYAEYRHGLAFSSEVKSLFFLRDLKRELDPQSLRQVATLWSPIPGATPFVGVSSVEPGEVINVPQHSEIKRRYYYTFPSVDQKITTSFTEAKELVFSQLRESVDLRMRSDVPVGAYISGGLDSSIVVALAREKTSNLTTFSIGFEDTGFDESPFQFACAEYLGVRHHHLEVKNRDIVDVFPRVVKAAEATQFRSAAAAMYLLASEARKAGFKVILTGEGADEAFLGYDLYKETSLRHNTKLSHEQKVNRIGHMFSYIPYFSTAKASALIRYLDQFTGDLDAVCSSHAVRFSLGAVANNLMADPRDPSNSIHALTEYLRRRYSNLPNGYMDRARILEYTTLLGGYLLSSQGDRMTAAHGIESRGPFLDHNMIELAMSLPDEYLLRDGLDEKFVLKEAFSGLLPNAVLSRPKQPFRAPDSKIFLGENYKCSWVPELFTKARIAEVGLFDPSAVVAFLERIRGISPDKVGPREDQAFMILLSTLLLHDQMIRSDSVC